MAISTSAQVKALPLSASASCYLLKLILRKKERITLKHRLTNEKSQTWKSYRNELNAVRLMFFSSFLLPLCCPYLHCEALSLYLSCALSFSLSHTCSLYFPCWKTGVGDSSLCPVKSLFHNMMRTMCLWLGLRGTDWEIEAGLCSSPLGSLKIGLHPWDHFKEFCTLTKSSCKLWITQVTVPCYAWTCSTETIALTIRLAFPMPTSSNRFVHIVLFSLLLLVPLRHPLLVLLFLLFFLCLSLISFFSFRLTLPRYYLLSTRQSMWELNKYHHRSYLIHGHRQPLCCHQ